MQPSPAQLRHSQITCSGQPWFRQALQGTLLALALFFTVNASAVWYGPFGGPITEYVYKTCYTTIWTIGSGATFDLGRWIEICAYYDADYELLGYSMEITY